jgi:hypothetical protein
VRHTNRYSLLRNLCGVSSGSAVKYRSMVSLTYLLAPRLAILFLQTSQPPCSVWFQWLAPDCPKARACSMTTLLDLQASVRSSLWVWMLVSIPPSLDMSEDFCVGCPYALARQCARDTRGWRLCSGSLACSTPRRWCLFALIRRAQAALKRFGFRGRFPRPLSLAVVCSGCSFECLSKPVLGPVLDRPVRVISPTSCALPSSLLGLAAASVFCDRWGRGGSVLAVAVIGMVPFRVCSLSIASSLRSNPKRGGCEGRLRRPTSGAIWYCRNTSCGISGPIYIHVLRGTSRRHVEDLGRGTSYLQHLLQVSRVAGRSRSRARLRTVLPWAARFVGVRIFACEAAESALGSFVCSSPSGRW